MDNENIKDVEQTAETDAIEADQEIIEEISVDEQGTTVEAVEQPADSTKPPKKKKKKTKIIIIVVVIVLLLGMLAAALLAVIGGIFGVGALGLGVWWYNKNNKTDTEVTATVEATEETLAPTDATTQAAGIVDGNSDKENGANVGEVDGYYITEPTLAYNYDYDYDYDDYYYGSTHYVTYDTPAHAGVNLRETPEDDSVKIMVLPEGTAVTRLYEAGETTETKYILVSVVVDGVEYTGYVMQRYVSTFSGASFDSYVSYNTPSHAGLVLRETSDGNSKKIMVIPEGTELRVTDNTTGAYWAVDAFYNGDIYSGYVLAKYIENY